MNDLISMLIIGIGLFLYIFGCLSLLAWVIKKGIDKNNKKGIDKNNI